MTRYHNNHIPHRSTSPSFCRREDRLNINNHLENGMAGTNANVYQVSLKRNIRGLGLSISGWTDASNPLRQLIVVKKLFPSEPAAECGVIQVGDIILEVNGFSVLGLNHMEAVNLLHFHAASMTSETVNLKFARCNLISSFEIQQNNEPSFINNFNDLDFIQNTAFNNEEIFEVTLHKIDGSLGFTIVKMENEGIFVKELIRDPALGDGRIKQGDKVLLVNGTDVTSLSHNGAIMFLRSLPSSVTLTLQRSNFNHHYVNTESESLPSIQGTLVNQPKKLRFEAQMMLKDKNRAAVSPNRFKKLKDKKRVRGIDSTDEVDNANCNIDDNVDPVLCRRSRPKSFSTNIFIHNNSGGNNSNEIAANLLRQCSISAAKLTNNESDHPTNECSEKFGFMRWRGTSLGTSKKDNGLKDSSLESSEFRDEHDSNYGEFSEIKPLDVSDISIELSYTEDMPQNNYMFEVTLDRKWHGRLGFSLTDGSEKEGRCCKIKEIFPGSMAARDGRLMKDDILVEVNGESIINKPAKEVIDRIRKSRGKIKMNFIRSLNQSQI